MLIGRVTRNFGSIAAVYSEGITNALKHDLDELILVPYFLYPGKKVKAAVTNAMAMQKKAQKQNF